MLSNDSIDKSAAEEAILERRAYGTAQHGAARRVWVLSVRQLLRDISIEQEKVHAMVTSTTSRTRRDQHRRLQWPGARTRSTTCGADAQAAREHAERTRRRSSSGCSASSTLIGRKKARSHPARLLRRGAHGALEVDQGGGRDRRRGATRAASAGIVNPDDPNALIGTANIGFAHGQSLVATDLTPFGHHRAFLMRLFSSGVQHRRARRQADAGVHCTRSSRAVHFEPSTHSTHTTLVTRRRFQEVSTSCCSAAARQRQESCAPSACRRCCPGWVKGSGSSSVAPHVCPRGLTRTYGASLSLCPTHSASGVACGMDYLCGRLVYYDGVGASVEPARCARH